MSAATEQAIHSLYERTITITLSPAQAWLIVKMIPVGEGVLSDEALQAAIEFLSQVNAATPREGHSP